MSNTCKHCEAVLEILLEIERRIGRKFVEDVDYLIDESWLIDKLIDIREALEGGERR